MIFQSRRTGPAPRTWRLGPRGSRTEKYRQPGNIKVPFCLQPEKHYVGVAWYQRDIEVPGRWQGKRLLLRLERVHWESRVWLDGNALGANASLSTPHRYDLGVKVAPGKHRLTLRIEQPAARQRRLLGPQRQRPYPRQLERRGRSHRVVGHQPCLD